MATATLDPATFVDPDRRGRPAPFTYAGWSVGPEQTTRTPTSRDWDTTIAVTNLDAADHSIVLQVNHWDLPLATVLTAPDEALFHHYTVGVTSRPNIVPAGQTVTFNLHADNIATGMPAVSATYLVLCGGDCPPNS